MSGDFVTGPVAPLIVDCFEHHSKTQLETTAISLRPGDGSETRLRIEAAFDRFLDAHAMPNAEIARMLRALAIDIAINLNGYPGRPCSGLFGHRTAPVQVNYLGYPGTTGAPFIDYIVADHLVIPSENQIHYSEKVAYLPDYYLPNDGKTPDRGMKAGPSRTGIAGKWFHLRLLPRQAEDKSDDV